MREIIYKYKNLQTAIDFFFSFIIIFNKNKQIKRKGKVKKANHGVDGGSRTRI